MKGMKGRLLKKIKSMKPPVGYLTVENRVLQVSSSNGCYVGNSCDTNFGLEIQNKLVFQERTEQNHKSCCVLKERQEPGAADVAELGGDDDDDDEEAMDDKENVFPEFGKVSSRRVSEAREVDDRRKPPEIEASRFRRPDLNSYSLFDPNLLAEFHRAVAEYFRAEKEKKEEEEAGLELPPSEPEPDPLSEFDEKCPPGGSESVIFYTTTLRGIRKTFEGCVGVRFLLESFRVVYSERDVSMHAEFRDEMRRVLGDRRAVPPRLFVRGRYIGGAEEVLGLHEQGRLRPLFDGIPVDRSGCPCEGCGGLRFVVCFGCSGSRKVVSEDGYNHSVCLECNENGLILCPLCC